LVGAFLFVVESDGVHQLVNDNKEMNAVVVETQLLCATNMTFLCPATAKIDFN
jgi:hypothetical protein